MQLLLRSSKRSKLSSRKVERSNYPDLLGAARNVARRYTVALSRDLFGASTVEFTWGRIGTQGRRRAVSFACEDKASRFARQFLGRGASALKWTGVPCREVSLAP